MTYCTLDDVKNRMDENEIIRYTDDDGIGNINTDVTDKALAAADALIDSHLAVKYTVPVSPVTDVLIDLAVDITIYKIHARRPGVPADVRTRYEDAVKYLEKAAAGKILIPGAAPAASSQSAGGVLISGPVRIFTRTGMEGF